MITVAATYPLLVTVSYGTWGILMMSSAIFNALGKPIASPVKRCLDSAASLLQQRFRMTSWYLSPTHGTVKPTKACEGRPHYHQIILMVDGASYCNTWLVNLTGFRYASVLIQDQNTLHSPYITRIYITRTYITRTYITRTYVSI